MFEGVSDDIAALYTYLNATPSVCRLDNFKIRVEIT